jgi:lipoprotein signal peptidase
MLGALFAIVIFWKRRFLDLIDAYRIGLAIRQGFKQFNRSLSRGFIIGFIDINLHIYCWPTFNAAGCVLCLAVIFLILP